MDWGGLGLGVLGGVGAGLDFGVVFGVKTNAAGILTVLSVFWNNFLLKGKVSERYRVVAYFLWLKFFQNISLTSTYQKLFLSILGKTNFNYSDQRKNIMYSLTY